MKETCIFCLENEADTKDHIPPKSFFPRPRPSNLITVPCCHACNQSLGKDDERARNLISALEIPEKHPGVISQIAPKRDRSLERPQGKSNLRHMLDSMAIVEVKTKAGIYTGSKAAFNFDQPEFDRFIDKMARGLLYHHTGLKSKKLITEWKFSPPVPNINEIPEMIMFFVRKYGIQKIGDDVFSYLPGYFPGKFHSLWLINFYNGIEFKVQIKEA